LPLQPTAEVGIIGTGLIGASIGLRARLLGRHVTGWDADPDHLRAALERGALDAVAPSAAATAESCDVLVLATPVGAVVDLLGRFRAQPPRAPLIIDVASLKLPVAQAAAGLDAFVPTHPIAGSERSGPESARADLFEGCAWTYDPLAAPAAVERAQTFITAMGARPVPLPSALHDEVAALTSHLPQVVAVALAGRLGAAADANTLALCGTGMRSMTRLGSSSWAMWEGILSANGPAVAQEVRRLSAILAEIADELESNRSQALRSRFAAAATASAGLTAETSPRNDAPPESR
jgi:prephenate dehydrogenase